MAKDELPKKKKRQRKKRQSVILPAQAIYDIEAEFSEAIQNALAIRESVFDGDSEHSIEDLAQYFINTSNETKIVFCH